MDIKNVIGTFSQIELILINFYQVPCSAAQVFLPRACPPSDSVDDLSPLLVLTELVRRAEDPCGPQLTAAAAAEQGGRTHRPGTVPFRHTLSHTHPHTLSSLTILSGISTHSEAEEGGGRAGAGVCSGDGEFEHLLFF